MNIIYWLITKIRKPYKQPNVYIYNAAVQDRIYAMTHTPIILLKTNKIIIYMFKAQSGDITDIFWKEINKTEAYGPFLTTYAAYNHYQWFIQDKKLNNLIKVNFRTKKRF